VTRKRAISIKHTDRYLHEPTGSGERLGASPATRVETGDQGFTPVLVDETRMLEDVV
jgi:hypothetical protein